MSFFADTPKGSYYAVIFSSQRSSDDNGYEDASDKVVKAVSGFKGFLGAESARDAQGFGITVSYWDSMESIQAWSKDEEHRKAKSNMKLWYEGYRLRICKVEQERRLII